jgi:hypothetical protein
MQTNTTITLTPVGEQKMRRTISDRTPRPAQSHLQDPTGQVICPYCNQETNIDAAGIFNILGKPVPVPGIRYHAPDRRIHHSQWTLCCHCTGPIGLSVSENQLFVAIAAIPEAVLAGEKIMDEKERARHAQEQEN